METTGLPTSLEGGSLHHNTRAPASDDACTTDVDWLLLSTETYAVSTQRSRQKPAAELVGSRLLVGYIVMCFSHRAAELNLVSPEAEAEVAQD